VPLLVQLPFSVAVFIEARVVVAAAPVENIPAPLNVPPLKVKLPFAVTFPVVVNVPPASVKSPFSVEFPARVRLPLLTVRVPPKSSNKT